MAYIALKNLLVIGPHPGKETLRRLGPLEPALDSDELVPQVGDRVMVVKQPWLDCILDGRKTLEIRGSKAKTGAIWVGMQGKVYARALIADTFTMTPEEFRARVDDHLWEEDWPLPYSGRLCGLQLANVRPLPSPLPYWRPGSAIGWNIFRTKEGDWPTKTKQKRAKEDAGVGAASGALLIEEDKAKTQPKSKKRKLSAPARQSQPTRPRQVQK